MIEKTDGAHVIIKNADFDTCLYTFCQYSLNLLPCVSIFNSVTGANAWIIGYISDKTKNNEDVFQKDLEKNFEITRSTASKVVNLMVEKGMVERQSVPWDARLKKLVLTDKGREINELMLEDFSVVEETLSKGFSEQELEQFFDYIHRMQQNMKDGFCNIGLKK